MSGRALLGDSLDRLGHRELHEPTSFRMTAPHRLWLPPAAAADPGSHHHVPLLRAVAQFSSPIDAGGPFDSGERGAPSPLDHPLKMRVLNYAAPRVLPGLFDIRVEVSGTGRGLRLLAANAEFRLRSLWGFLNHVPTPWIWWIRPRVHLPTRDRKHGAKGRALLKASRAPDPPLPSMAVLRLDHPLVGLDDQLRCGLHSRHGSHLEAGSEPSPSLRSRGRLSDAAAVVEVLRPRQDEHLDP